MQISVSAPEFRGRTGTVGSCELIGGGIYGSICDIVLDDGKECKVGFKFLKKVEV